MSKFCNRCDQTKPITAFYGADRSWCADCGSELAEQERTVDHITPMRYGGSNTLDNVTCACLSCNSIKKDTPVILYFIQNGCEVDEITRLLERMALRQGTTFEQTLSQLNEDVNAYFLRRAEKAGEQLTT